MKVKICHSYKKLISFKGTFLEWPYYFEKQGVAEKVCHFLPHICDIMSLDIEDQLDIYIRKRDTRLGCYYANSPSPRELYISLAEIEFYIPRLPLFTAITERMSDINIDWHIFVLAHELTHHKQYMEKRYDHIVTLGLVYWNGEYLSPRLYPTHYEKPWEIEANATAENVIRELNARGLL